MDEVFETLTKHVCCVSVPALRQEVTHLDWFAPTEALRAFDEGTNRANRSPPTSSLTYLHRTTTMTPFPQAKYLSLRPRGSCSRSSPLTTPRSPLSAKPPHEVVTVTTTIISPLI
jgi:hypothetical protein